MKAEKLAGEQECSRKSGGIFLFLFSLLLRPFLFSTFPRSWLPTFSVAALGPARPLGSRSGKKFGRKLVT